MFIGLGLAVTQVVSNLLQYLITGGGDFLVTETGDFIILE